MIQTLTEPSRDGFNHVGALGPGSFGGPFLTAAVKKISNVGNALFDFSAKLRKLSKRD